MNYEDIKDESYDNCNSVQVSKSNYSVRITGYCRNDLKSNLEFGYIFNFSAAEELLRFDFTKSIDNKLSSKFGSKLDSLKMKSILPIVGGRLVSLNLKKAYRRFRKGNVHSGPHSTGLKGLLGQFSKASSNFHRQLSRL
ncbi:hypothetical protein [Bacillus ndiopicus]|uniref:hypothetical protein n=1 Tax=Bacillus ndiopicus TaxID=1347368 RepID=UPI0018A811D3|nr:hypothetical protein [Bacillus ndiopicus]